ncbi:L,D-transpeptidase [Flavobacterium cheongpyeongense]|jgi:murein L,D-transpeptidase YcbB/YkuD|uniref:L,D-transpeptidase n=1 Tax=Flavobacterium cheongpyeongense TaxID=2212651 RepID=A0A2V4BSP3_9FLAO|nr:L,D-transpeptidase family protein [Flavobacterium cheongpyeongense]PXY41657.1 L,D-transpeptidase [Flavobacterium cheongpyeongense]
MKQLQKFLLIIAIAFVLTSFGFNDKDIKPMESLYVKENQAVQDKSDSTSSVSKSASKEVYLLSSQYDRLQTALDKYEKIQRKKLWRKIDIDSATYKNLKPFDSGVAVKQIRERLYIDGDLKKNSKSSLYDEELMAGVLNYKKRYGLKLNYKLTFEHIKQMNESVSERIKTLKLNMERCRLIPESLIEAKDYIMVNIPAYRLLYVKNGVNEFVSDVFVGTIWSETEIFSSTMDRVVFSPYWNIPQSIIDNELKLNMGKDKNYLEEHNMEWNGGRVRQRPGSKNSLGLVKFLFPNPFDIYMHDTPAKSLFMFEQRTFSHGCINIKEAKKLAYAILKDDPDWSAEKIDSAMDGVNETTCMLKKPILIYIGYFTCWVNEETGEVYFYPDVYQKDKETETDVSNGLVMD